MPELNPSTPLERLRARLRAGETAIGTWLSCSSPEVGEALASMGFDWLVVDMEHGSADVHTAMLCFLAAERHGCVPMARLPSADPYLARRLLDQGAQGLVIPVVESADALNEFLRHCFYPPKGRRGVALGRFDRWGDDFASYLKEFQPFVVAQIETPAGIAAASTIAAIPEVDVLFIGPYDLSANLGKPGQFDTPEFTAALSDLKTACTRHRKVAGGHQVQPEIEKLQRLVTDGFRFVAYGTDLIALRHALRGFEKVRKS
jgi:2-keto-3-deoxy-L-rhamnonate aldolase RhmA